MLTGTLINVLTGWLLSILFLFLTLLLGEYILFKVGLGKSLKLSFIEELSFSLLIGTVITSWVIFLLALYLKSLSISVVFFMVFSCILYSYDNKTIKEIMRRTKKSMHYWLTKTSRLEWIMYIIIILVSFTLIMRVSLFTHNGEVYASNGPWSDMAFQISMMRSFSKSNNFPPRLPLYYGIKMRYHFMPDFYSAVLDLFGLGVVESLQLPSFLYLSIIFILFYRIIIRFYSRLRIKKKHLVYIGLISLILLSLSGGFQFLNFIRDYKHNNPYNIPLLKFYLYINKDYSCDGTNNAYLINFLQAIVAKKAAVIGFALFMMFLLILIEVFINKKELSNKEYFLLGLILGLTLLFRHETFVASVVLFSFFLLLYYKKIGVKSVISFFIPLLMTSLPEYMYTRGGSAIEFMPGWMLDRFAIKDFFSLWLFNLGVLPFLVISTLILFYINNKKRSMNKKESTNKRKGRRINNKRNYGVVKDSMFTLLIPTILIFLLFNFIKVPKGAWDNVLFFTTVQVVLIIYASYSLYVLLFNNKIFLKLLGVVLMLVLISTGLLLIPFWSHRYLMFSNYDLKISNFIIKNTRPNSVFLCSSRHNHPLILTGRNIFLSYQGWLWAWNINFTTRENIRRFIYESNDYPRVRDVLDYYNITHIYIGNYEMEEYNINKEFFDNNFYIIYKDENTTIYSVT